MADESTIPGDLRPGDVADLVARLRRAMRRAARAHGAATGLSVAQLELLTVVAERPGARSGDLATTLRLAPNSVSTLANGLVQTGMLERRTGIEDRRTVELVLTPGGEAALGAWQHANEQIVRVALGGLAAADRRRVEQALPALGELVALIDAQADDAASPTTDALTAFTTAIEHSA